ncbi:TPR repeat protein [Reticulomyxa filosa]|uniref:TPR repeat protein n=1 Tax=Reticulomyxa filosa TaxID=46433 RepID=X6LPB3_RETFI|nr:TPR repeat protein [Reticulomyxa filosa]|eukprot:ETO02972.1 TPR repeat protein [Reticulomyxa filosa]
MNKIGILAILVVFFPFVSLALPSTNRLEEHLKIATQYYKQGKLALAEAECKKAVELDPKDAIAHGILGSVYNNQGKLALAEAECKKAIELDPKNLTWPAPQNIYSADEFDPSLTPTEEQLGAYDMNPKLPISSAEKVAYLDDVKTVEDFGKEAEEARIEELSIIILKSKIGNLPTGLFSPAIDYADRIAQAVGIGRGLAAKATDAFREVQKYEIKRLAKMGSDLKTAYKMASDTRDTLNSIKERLDAQHARAMRKQIKVQAKKAWVSLYGDARDFEGHFNLWFKNQKKYAKQPGANNLDANKQLDVLEKKLEEKLEYGF